jgi:hypothetical protein
MHLHPDLMLSLAHDRQRDLMDEAARARLRSAARRVRRAAKNGAAAGYSPVASGRPTGSLTPCERHVAA